MRVYKFYVAIYCILESTSTAYKINCERNFINKQNYILFKYYKINIVRQLQTIFSDSLKF